jgi:muramoyltetrapeptide carboxypeptidase
MRDIYIYSPSSAVRDKAAFRRGVKQLQGLDCTVTVDEAALGSHMRFAGDDATRLAAIGRAAASHADVAMIARGGYGLTRLLADLPYDAIAKSAAHGTRWVGLSDFTAFQAAVYVKTGTVTWQGPDVVADFGSADGPDEIMQACFEDLLLCQGEGTGWRLPTSEARPEGWGTAGRLWGGNLSMLCGLLGTPYFPSIKGGILFLEDVGEHPYRIERMLTQLLHAGVLGRQKAVLLGQFTHYKLVAGHDKGFKLATVVDWLRSQIAAPVFTSLPFGHVATKVLLPFGAQVDLSVQGRDAMVLWGPMDGHTH